MNQLFRINIEGAASPAPEEIQTLFNSVTKPALGTDSHVFVNLFTTPRGTFLERARFGYDSFVSTKNCAGVIECFHIAITKNKSYILYEG